ncbi:VPLPA-CTERM sorting domain-containing protein [Rhodobacterales bacterium HKCCE2091]|nr:VPLPA-CTERM sorting domain-containing protein [Rhodobacterales bacterium HKCCE2091]
MRYGLKAALAGVAAAVISATTAGAATLTYTDLVQNTEIDDYYFTVTAAGTVIIDVRETYFGDPIFPYVGNFDSEINLFRDDGNLTLDDFIENDDDGGLGLESRIVRTLAAGSYLLRVGTHNFGNVFGTDAVIIGATNTGGHHGYTDYTLTISGSVIETPSAVPLPAAGFLLAGGVGGLAVMRRRRARG